MLDVGEKLQKLRLDEGAEVGDVFPDCIDDVLPNGEGQFDLSKVGLAQIMHL